MAFRNSRFELIETDHLEFNDLALVADELGLDAEYLTRNNVAAVCVLRDRRDGHLLLVASAHLFWELQCVDIKLLQAATILRRVNDVVTRHRKVRSVVVCGDFNSTPNCATFFLLTTGKLDLGSGDCAELPPAVLNYIHNVLIDCTTVPCLQSAYRVGDNDETGVISTFTDKYSGLIDFILYRHLNNFDDHLVQKSTGVSTLSLPTVKQCEEAVIVAFPSRECPSDYLPLAAILNLARMEVNVRFPTAPVMKVRDDFDDAHDLVHVKYRHLHLDLGAVL